MSVCVCECLCICVFLFMGVCTCVRLWLSVLPFSSLLLFFSIATAQMENFAPYVRHAGDLLCGSFMRTCGFAVFSEISRGLMVPETPLNPPPPFKEHRLDFVRKRQGSDFVLGINERFNFKEALICVKCGIPIL